MIIYRTGCLKQPKNSAAHLKSCASLHVQNYQYKEKQIDIFEKANSSSPAPSNELGQSAAPQNAKLPLPASNTLILDTNIHVVTVQSRLTLEDFLRLLLVQTTTSLSGCLLN